MSKHTKGPWERVDTEDYAEIHRKGERDKTAVALVARASDADLIAAAPELLEALTELLDLNENQVPFGGEIYLDRIDRAWYAARTAISKATGE